MGQSGQGAQGGDDIGRIAEQIVADIELVQFLECGHVGGEQLQAIAVEGEGFQVFELGEDGHHELQVVDLPGWGQGYLNSRLMILRSLSACSSSLRSFMPTRLTDYTTQH